MLKPKKFFLLIVLPVCLLVLIFSVIYYWYRILPIKRQQSLVQPPINQEIISGRIVEINKEKIILETQNAEQKEFLLTDNILLRQTPPEGGVWRKADFSDLKENSLVALHLFKINNNSILDRIDILPALKPL